MTQMPHLTAINIVALAYVLGSVPVGFLLGKIWDINPREVGSGNIGTANIFRHVSPLAGLLSLICDAGKGYLAVYIALQAAPGGIVPLLAAVAAVSGHNWMLFLKFRGGKGIATSAGALLALSLPAIPIVLAVMIILTLLLRDTNTGSALGMLALPFYLYFAGSWPAFSGGLLWAAIVIIKFRPDIIAYRAGRRTFF